MTVADAAGSHGRSTLTLPARIVRRLIYRAYEWFGRRIMNAWYNHRFQRQMRRDERLRLSVIRRNLAERWKGLQYWQLRIRDVLECPDNNAIPRAANAGTVANGVQIMHNGLKIVAGSYGGEPVRDMLAMNGGVHEPQEERVFAAVLPFMPRGAVMVELGAYWAFYSMWFAAHVADARCYMVEPVAEHLDFGRRNCALNGVAGEFVQAYVGSENGRTADGRPIICLDDFAAERHLDFIHLLHSDIQGFELAMLEGSSRLLRQRRVGHWFISTHSNALHQACSEKLQQQGYEIITSVDCDASYSVDGVLVARSPEIAGPGPIAVSRKGRRPRWERELLRHFAAQG